MNERIITGLLLVVALIHLAPIVGFFGIEQLTALYEIDVVDRNVEILMRHRAVLFGILGGFIAYAAFRPAHQPIAFAIAFVSVASFIYLSFSIGGFNVAIRKVVIADLVAAAALLSAVVLYVAKKARLYIAA